MSKFEETKENNTEFEFENTEVGARIRFYRKNLHLTQEQLALSAGIAQMSVNQIEKGNFGMNCSTLMRICDVLNVTPNDILLPEVKDNFGIQEMSQVIVEGLDDEQQRIVLDMMRALYHSFKNIQKNEK